MIEMTKYRKKPVVIEAEQYKEGMEDGFTNGETDHDDICILTPYIKHPSDEFMCLISNGDWIITEANGRRSPCKPDIFEETYERVE